MPRVVVGGESTPVPSGDQNRVFPPTSRCPACFFFDQCCARHNNCGSHVTVLKQSSVDNSIAKIGQQHEKTNEKHNPTTPTSKQAKPTSSDQSMKR